MLSKADPDSAASSDIFFNIITDTVCHLINTSSHCSSQSPAKSGQKKSQNLFSLKPFFGGIWSFLMKGGWGGVGVCRRVSGAYLRGCVYWMKYVI